MTDLKKHVYAPRDMAAAHCRSADVIENRYNDLNQTEPQNAGDHSAMFISAAILRAFSIELALKSLCFADNSRWPSGHDLHALFNKQAEASQSEIEAIAKDKLSRDLNSVLEEIANLFVQWRYIHDHFGEGKEFGFDSAELRDVAHAVMAVLDKRIEALKQDADA